MDEEKIERPFDPSFAEEALLNAADRHLPPAHMSMTARTTWTESWENGERVTTGFTTSLIRDLSRIDMNIDFGNMPFRLSDAERGCRLAMRNFGAAADAMMAARRHLSIHAATAMLCAACPNDEGATGWDVVRERLDYPLTRRTLTRIAPRGWHLRIHDEKLQWGSSDWRDEKFRLPGKRILGPWFDIEGAGRMSYERVRLDGRLPETFLVGRIPGPLEGILAMPGIEEAGITVTGHHPTSKGTELLIRSATLDMEEAFATMARVIDKVGPTKERTAA